MNLAPVPWKPGYLVSDAGLVFSVWSRRGSSSGRGTLVARNVVVGSLRQLQPFDRKNTKGEPTGYLSVSMGRGCVAYVHRLVLESFIGPAPSEEHDGCHGDGDRANNRLGNLRWDTKKANAADRVRHAAEAVILRREAGHAFAGLGLDIAEAAE